MNFNLIAESGLTQSEFAAICDVSRTTVNLWVLGKMNPNRYITHKVRAHLDSLEKAIADGVLPTAKRVPQERREIIAKAITPAESNN